MILLDTHILVWAITGDTTKLCQKSFDKIDRAIGLFASKLGLGCCATLLWRAGCR